MLDLGDVYPATITITNPAGTPQNATLVQVTFTLPDGTQTVAQTVVGTAGVYAFDFPTTQMGLHGERWLATGTNACAVTNVFEVGDPAALPIISLADAKDHLQITDSSLDEKLRSYLADATEMAENYCNRALRRRTYVESQPGGDYHLMLRRSPVLSITSITNIAGTTYDPATYRLDANAGIVYRWGPVWGAPPFFVGDNVTITYVAGYANPPLAAQRGVKEILRWLWQTQQQGPRAGFGQQGQLPGTDAIPNWIYRPLDPLVMPVSG